MGLLNSMTVKFGIDLSDLKAGITEAKSIIQSITSATSETSAALKGVSTAFQGGELTSQVSSATSSIASLRETASVTGESLLSVGTDAEEMGSEVAAGSEEAASSLSNVKTQSEQASGGFGGLVQSFGGGIGNMVSNLFSFGAHLTTTLVNMGSLAQGAVSFASSLLAPAASAKEIESSLEIFDGSAQKAQAELASLANFAANTPFSTTSIDEAALHLQGVGIKAQDVQPDIKALGDALDAMGSISAADLSGLVADFSKIQTQGHLTTDVMNSFALRGIDAWKVLEDQTGKSRSQLETMISKGLYPAKDAMKDLTEGIEKNPLYHGQMANDTKGWAGALSNLKANFDQVLVSLGSPIIDGLVPIFTDIGKQLTSPAFKEFAGAVGSGIAGTFKNIMGAAKGINFSEIGKDVQQLGGWFKSSLMPAIDQARPGFEHIATTVGHLAKEALPPLLKVAGDLIPKVVTLAGNFAGGLATGIEDVVSVGTNIVGFFQHSQLAMDGLAAVVATLAAGLLVFAITSIPAVVAGMIAWAASMIPVVVEALLVAAPFILIGVIVAAVIFGIILAIQHWGEIVKWLQGVWGAVAGFFVGLFNGIMGFFKQWGPLILAILTGPVGLIIYFWKPITQFFAGVWSGIVSVFQGAAAWFHDKVWQPISDKFAAVFNGLKGIASGVWSSITGAVRAAFNTVIDLINNGISGINNISSKVGIPAIPLLPHLHTGGVVKPGTFAVAGDPGPNSEIIYGGEAGATVFSHSQSMAMAASGAGAGGGGGRPQEIHIHFGDEELAVFLVDPVASHIVKKLYGHGPVRAGV